MENKIDVLLSTNEKYGILKQYFTDLSYDDLCSTAEFITQESMTEIVPHDHKLLMAIFCRQVLFPAIKPEKEDVVPDSWEDVDVPSSVVEVKDDIVVHSTTDIAAIARYSDKYSCLDEYFEGFTIERVLAMNRNPTREFFIDLCRKDDRELMTDFVDFVVMPSIETYKRSHKMDELLPRSFEDNGSIVDAKAYMEELTEYPRYPEPTAPPAEDVINLDPIAVDLDDINLETDNSDDATVGGYDTDLDDLYGDEIEECIATVATQYEAIENENPLSKLVEDNINNDGILDLSGKLKGIQFYDLFSTIKKLHCLDKIKELNMSGNNINRLQLVYVDYIVDILKQVKIVDLSNNNLVSSFECRTELNSILGYDYVHTLDVRNNPMSAPTEKYNFYRNLEKHKVWKLIWLPENDIEMQWWCNYLSNFNLINITKKTHRMRYKYDELRNPTIVEV